jgi:hypothetical protein
MGICSRSLEDGLDTRCQASNSLELLRKQVHSREGNILGYVRVIIYQVFLPVRSLKANPRDNSRKRIDYTYSQY